MLACAKSGSEQGMDIQRVRVITPLPAPPPLLIVALVAKLVVEVGVGLREVRVGVSVVSMGWSRHTT